MGGKSPDFPMTPIFQYINKLIKKYIWYSILDEYDVFYVLRQNSPLIGKKGKKVPFI